MERDNPIENYSMTEKDFNSHAHVERDPCMYGDFQNFRNFNSHAHVERDDRVIQQSLNRINFNSHAHMERDKITTPHYIVHIISTHTLTWSVTVFFSDKPFADPISTHTLTWSVTVYNRFF